MLDDLIQISSLWRGVVKIDCNKNTNEYGVIKFEYNQKDLHPELKSKKVRINLKDVTTVPYFKNETVELEADLSDKDNIRVCCKNYSALLFTGIIFLILGISFIFPIFFYKDGK